VYLIAAEAEARANGPTAVAYTAINAVRKRAGIPDLTPGLTKDAFIEAVLQERSWELCFEADRWYDLERASSRWWPGC
jgi:starch-binding outer membrane protein, SusD/RagB family